MSTQMQQDSGQPGNVPLYERLNAEALLAAHGGAVLDGPVAAGRSRRGESMCGLP